MTASEKLLASRLLEVAGDSFSNHGCNDCESKWFKGIGVTERSEMTKRWNFYNCHRHIDESDDDWIPFRLIGDYAWMGYLAAQLLKESSKRTDNQQRSNS